MCVNLSTLTTPLSVSLRRYRHTADPINPAPPVTRTRIRPVILSSEENWYSSLIIKKARQITEGREPPILFRKCDGIGLKRPVNSKILVAPENTGIMSGAVIVSYFVENLGLVFKRAITRQEARR